MNTFNISQYPIGSTATTSLVCARQRAQNISNFYGSSKSVLELCVGPSLPVLEQEYNRCGLKVSGNDIDIKYKKQSPGLIVGDCFNISYSPYDVVVFAPPLSQGCSGTREDSLSIDKVTPSYYDFVKLRSRGAVLVLPGRSMATKRDREQYYKLLSFIGVFNHNFIVVSLIDKVVKYYDVYLI